MPLIYGRAALNNWQAFADARIASISPRGNSLFWDSTALAAGPLRPALRTDAEPAPSAAGDAQLPGRARATQRDAAARRAYEGGASGCWR